MYDVNKTVQLIKDAAKRQGKSTGSMLEEIGLNKNTLSSMKSRESWIASDSLAKIADYLGVSVDYLLGREIKNAPDEDVRGDIIERIRSLSEADAERLRILVETVFPDQGGE